MKPVLNLDAGPFFARKFRRRRGSRPSQSVRLAAATVLCLSIVVLECGKPAAAQVNPDETFAADDCNRLEQDRAFDLRLGSQKIISKFIARPDVNAGAAQIQRHMTYLQILGEIAAAQVYNLSSRQCLLVPEIDYASLGLNFGVVSHPGDKCLQSLCASRLSRFLQSAVADPSEFLTAIDAISAGIRRSESVDLKYPMLSANRAAAEAYRHIYPPGSRERIYFDLVSQDYNTIGFEAYAGWFLEQQSGLRDLLAGKVSPAVSSDDDSLSKPQSEDKECAASQDDQVQEVKIDHHGWGQRSLIMINHARRQVNRVEINNAALQAFCDPHRDDMEGRGTFPWSEMGERIQCYGQDVSQDRWLVLFAKVDPPSGEDMSRFAEGIRKTLRTDKCVRPNPQIFVVKFLRQN
jgi:hypothetical protein